MIHMYENVMMMDVHEQVDGIDWSRSCVLLYHATSCVCVCVDVDYGIESDNDLYST